MNKYLIVPDCSDLNRGDQALVWETIRLAKDAGFEGDFYIQSDESLSPQSIERGIKCFSPILLHPSRNTHTNNIHYGLLIKFKWGLVALWDLFVSLLVLLLARRPNSVFCRLLLPHKIKETLVLYNNANAVFVKGGGFLQSYNDITAFYYIYYHLYPIYLAHRLKVPVHIMPNSFGPIDGFTAKWQVRKALKKCKTCACRESISYEYMTHCFPDIHFILSDDLGFYLKPNPLTPFPLKKNGKPMVAITVRPYRFPEHKSGEQLYIDYINSVASFCVYLISEGKEPVFVQHTLATNSHEDDAQCIKDISRLLGFNEIKTIMNSSYSCQDLKEVYSHFDYIVGTRFHSVIFSLACGVPAISIAYGGNKSTGIMHDNGLDDYVIPIDVISASVLKDKFDKLDNNKEEYKRIIKERMDCIHTRRDEYIKYIKEHK